MSGIRNLFCKSVVFILMLSFSCIPPLTAQEADLPPPAAEEPAQTPEQHVLELDIKTSTLSELAAWCRSLGLSEGGTREELANRLRTHYKLPYPDTTASEGEKKQRIITIESARSTEYFTLDVVDEEYARLQGGVVVSLKDGEAIHRIKAGQILYNRTRNLMTASGGVEYIKEEGEAIETFKGESITVNLDNWSSIFLDGVTERAMTNDTSTYRFAGTLISRSDEDVTVLSNATISNAKNEEAYWSLNAYKLWLLPGADWAVLNAVLKVGEIPVFYFPFFHFAADERIFHPAIGYRSRVGNFVQTTSYILGRSQSSGSTESSLSKIMGNSADMEKTREGIFLRSTGKQSRDPNDTRLSVLFDAYTNLGAYMGTELVLPKRGILGTANLSSGIGFTRDIYMVSGGYTPFAQYDGSDQWNNANLFSAEVPFRYRFNTTGTLSGGTYGTMTWNIPFYADPYVNRDFLDRSEEMDWVNLFKREEEEDSITKNIIGPYDWRLNASLTPSVTTLNPYISSLSISNVSSAIAFKTRPSTLITNGVSPNRNFFFPDTLTIYSINGSIAGTPFTLGNTKTNQTAKQEEPPEDPFQGVGTLRSPWETIEVSESDQAGAPNIDQLNPPVLTQRFDLPRSGDPRFDIDYQLTPSSASQLQFRSSQQNWPEAEDIDWSEISSILTNFKADGRIGFTLKQPETNLYTTSLRFSATGQWQGHTYLNEEAEEYAIGGVTDQTKIDNARLTNYKATLLNTSYNFTTTLKPLYQNAIWGNSSIQYDLVGRITRSEFDGTVEDPSWTMKYGEWTKEDVTTHQMGVNMAASIMDNVQNLSITTDLPPRDTTLGGNATLRAWITETNIRHRIANPWDAEIRKFEPVYFVETLRWGTGTAYPFQLKQDAAYDPELEEWTNLTSSLSWIGLSASFTATRSRTYTREITGWVQTADPEKLNPREIQLGYTQTLKKDSLWNNRFSVSFNTNTRLTFDLQRYTYSRLTFSMSVTLGITNLLNITLSTSSENAVIFRYFPSLFDLPEELPGERNFFVDLLNSFRFDDESLRRSSGFKLKTFNLSIIHHLGDWNAKLGITLSPYLDQTVQPYQYKFNNEISFLVQWVPISEIKTEIISNKDKIVFK